jgi:hypothetical protein
MALWLGSLGGLSIPTEIHVWKILPTNPSREYLIQQQVLFIRSAADPNVHIPKHPITMFLPLFCFRCKQPLLADAKECMNCGLATTISKAYRTALYRGVFVGGGVGAALAIMVSLLPKGITDYGGIATAFVIVGIGIGGRLARWRFTKAAAETGIANEQQ